MCLGISELTFTTKCRGCLGISALTLTRIHVLSVWCGKGFLHQHPHPLTCKVSGISGDAGARWYNRDWHIKGGSTCDGKPVYVAKSQGKITNRFLIWDKGQNRWKFTDGVCKKSRNWHAGGTHGARCPSDNEKKWQAKCTKDGKNVQAVRASENCV